MSLENDRKKDEKEILAREFEEAAKDEELKEEMEIWDICIGDGLDD
jgi:hypothetical protein